MLRDFTSARILPVLMDSEGKEINNKSAEGNLCIKNPWPGIARTIYGDHQRYGETYFPPTLDITLRVMARKEGKWLH